MYFEMCISNPTQVEREISNFNTIQQNERVTVPVKSARTKNHAHTRDMQIQQYRKHCLRDGWRYSENATVKVWKKKMWCGIFARKATTPTKHGFICFAKSGQAGQATREATASRANLRLEMLVRTNHSMISTCETMIKLIWTAFENSMRHPKS